MEIRAEGTLVCGIPAPHYRMMELEEIRAKLRPLVISEIEEPGVGDQVLDQDKIFKVKTIQNNEQNNADEKKAFQNGLRCWLEYEGGGVGTNLVAKKILLMSEEFDRDDLMAIVEGWMENGDHVCL